MLGGSPSLVVPGTPVFGVGHYDPAPSLATPGLTALAELWGWGQGLGH